jgi:fatty acid desaturase
MRQYPIPWRLNCAIVAVQLLAALGTFYLASLATAWWQVALSALIFAIVGNSIYASMHEAEHGMLLPNRLCNGLLGSLLGLFFPAPFHLLRQGHLGHHWRNRSDDEAFDYYFPGENTVWKWLQLYGVLTGLFWLTIVFSNFVVLIHPSLLRRKFEFDRPTAALVASLNPRYWRLIRLESLAALLLHASIVWILGIPLASYCAVYCGFGMSWSAMQYVHHFGTERHVTGGARNLWLFAPIDLVWLHHNWHQTHHEQPTLPWIYLPRMSAEAGKRREFLLWHYLRMWRGPRLTSEHVENRYAERIIR